MKSLRDIIPEGYEENKKKHGEAAEDYAGKIKCLCKELTDLTGKYDSYTLKSVARELEDIFERIDCDVESRKDQKKRDAAYVSKSPSVAMHEGENLSELSTKLLLRYANKARDQKMVAWELNDHKKEKKRGTGLGLAFDKLLKHPRTKVHAKEENLNEGKKKNQALIRKFMSHDPEAAERIISFGEKSRREAKAFKSAKSEINRLKKKEKKIDEGKFNEKDIERQEKEHEKEKSDAKKRLADITIRRKNFTPVKKKVTKK